MGGNLKGRAVSLGDIYVCDFGETIGSVQGGIRLCIIIDNQLACRYSPTIHVVCLTTKTKKDFPLHYTLRQREYSFLDGDSIVLCEQYQLIDKVQLSKKIGRINSTDIVKIVEKVKKNLPF